MAKKSSAKRAKLKPSALADTRVIYCGDNLEQLKKLPDACVDLIYIVELITTALKLNLLGKATGNLD